MEKKWIAPKSTRLQRGKLIIVKHYIQLSWILYVFGIFWIFLFPRISISTGELKCRGTYFSENALLMYSSVPQITPEYVNCIPYLVFLTLFFLLGAKSAATSKAILAK